MNQPSPKIRRGIVSVLLALLFLSTFLVSGFTVFDSSHPSAIAPEGLQSLRNVIKNGDFEQNPTSSVATHWQPYSNGQAHFGWYDEKWAEAIHSGQHSQLLEIFQVEGPVPDRVIGIYQTVQVVPNTVYNLTFFAMLRTDAPIELRNQDQYGMDWGIDYTGQGKYHLVQQWQPMTMTEQLRIGSNTVSNDEPKRLFFEQFTGTIFTGNNRQLTLFIRGVKREPTGTEVNFNIDDVALLGPYPLPPTATPTPTGTPTFPFTPTPSPTGTSTPTPSATLIPTPVPTLNPPLPVTGDQAVPPNQPNPLPAAGAAPLPNLSPGTIFFGGATLLILGVYALKNLLAKQKKP